MFKAIMKHNNDLKKDERRQGRLTEARNQLQIAQSMFTSYSSRATTDKTSSTDEGMIETLKAPVHVLALII
jgi:hypothetical protein